MPQSVKKQSVASIILENGMLKNPTHWFVFPLRGTKVRNCPDQTEKQKVTTKLNVPLLRFQPPTHPLKIL